MGIGALTLGLASLGACAVDSPAEPACPQGYWSDEAGLCRLVAQPPDDPWPWGEGEVPCESDEEQGMWTEANPLCSNSYPGDLRIESAADMADFCENWDCVDGGIDIGGTETGRGEEGGAESIVDLAPLSCLRAARYVFISEAPNLSHIELPELQATGGGLSLISNASLERLALPKLGKVGGDLSIQGNPLLGDISLPRLHDILEFLFIVDNPSMPTSQAHALRDRLCPEHVGGAITIVGNGHGAIIRGQVRREAESPNGAVGQLLVTAFGPGPPSPDNILGIYNADVDLTDPETLYPYALQGIQPLEEPCRVEAFLDLDGSGPMGGPTSGDLTTLPLLEVPCDTEGISAFDLVLTEVAP